MSGNRIASLDGLRAISIALVITGHSANTFPSSLAWSSQLMPFFGNSGLGVSMFFVISGFLITKLLLRELQEKRTISIHAFYIRRAFRIWPAFYLMIGSVTLMGLAKLIPLKKMEVISASLFFWNYYPNGVTWFLGHTWSLAVEEQFYLLWPVLLLALKPRKAAWFAGLVIVAEPLIRVMTYELTPSLRGHIPIMFHTRADTMMIGSIAALIQDTQRFRRFLAEVFRLRLHLMAILFMVALDPLLQQRYKGAYSLSVGWSLQNVAIVLALLWAIEKAHTRVGRLLNSPLFVHFGVISFSLYLWQQIFLTKLNPLFGTFPLNLACVAIVGEASYWFIEKPFLKLRMKTMNGRANTSSQTGLPRGRPDQKISLNIQRL